MPTKYFSFYLCALVFVSLQLLCHGIPLEKELTLTKEEKLALDKFRSIVVDKLTHEYMNKDIYLIKWLRARNLNVKDATKMLMDNLKWRKENRIDDILDEDWTYYQKKYPFWLDGRDNFDRPVGTADISVWDPRPVILAGKGQELIRFAISVLEMGARMVREDQENGRNVTQFTIVANLDGFNLIQHGCIRCIPIYIQFFLAYETYFPGMLHKLYFVNTPVVFDVVLQLVLPVLHPETREALEIVGTNKNQWKNAVLEAIPADQIRPQFGGTKLTDLDLDFDLENLDNL